jgi:hypothetical protein
MPPVSAETQVLTLTLNHIFQSQRIDGGNIIYLHILGTELVALREKRQYGSYGSASTNIYHQNHLASR